MTCRVCGKEIAVYVKGHGSICQTCYLREYQPTDYMHGPWIYVSSEKNEEKRKQSNRREKKAIKNYRLNGEILEITYNDESVDHLNLTPENIDEIALNKGPLSGKWMVFERESEINQIWLIIAKATINGELGIASKVSTALTSKGKSYVICVYTVDYFDEESVNRVRRRLSELGIKQSLRYKPDIYTLLGIYSKTTKLVPYRYSD
ncbi:MAG: DUF1917 domain-containing protein [Candidatus Heimdallarchaeota archaeon]|nr:DUF1917 domain-containing protein [Candidatus Heimdallarchaeota archaeon]MCK4290966.1 DUF1917 domain-containing protein [Candidatus Heimdallarchaeota archaeon]